MYRIVIEGIPEEHLAVQLKELNEHAIRFNGAEEMGLSVRVEEMTDGD